MNPFNSKNRTITDAEQMEWDIQLILTRELHFSKKEIDEMSLSQIKYYLDIVKKEDEMRREEEAKIQRQIGR